MGGTAGVTRPGNTVLIEYGIQNEKSDLRAHVSVVGRCVYVYRTETALSVIASNKYRKVPVMTGNIVTATGYVVPPSDIANIKIVDIPEKIMLLANFSQFDSTSAKGDKAVKIIKWLLKSGLFPLAAMPEVITDKDLQIEGTDILVKLESRIQVKCDYKAGDRSGCTGNLFLQVSECNPFRSH